MTLLIVALMMLACIYVGLVLPYYTTRVFSSYQKNKEFASLIPTYVKSEKLCKGPHTWIESISVDDSGEYSPINICSNCGFLPTKNMMASEEGLRRIISNNKIKEFEESIQKDFVEKETSDLTRLLEGTLTSDKIGEIYRAGQTSNKRYIIYKIARAEEMRREQKDGV